MLGKIGTKLYKNGWQAKNIFELKPFKKLPERLIFPTFNDQFIMFSPKTGKQLGIMRAYLTSWPAGKSYYPEIKKDYKCIYIDGLIVNEKLKGVGRDFIKFAKNWSKNSKAEGKINILAWCLDDSKTCPQVFYHKMGFTTANKKHLAEIMRLEKIGTKQPKLFGDWNIATNMYLKKNA